MNESMITPALKAQLAKVKAAIESQGSNIMDMPVYVNISSPYTMGGSTWFDALDSMPKDSRND